MSDEIDIKDKVSAILNPAPEWERTPLKEQENLMWGEFNFKSRAVDFSLEQEVLPEGSAIVDEVVAEVSITDLKGKTFIFPGSFVMGRDGDKISFKATK